MRALRDMPAAFMTMEPGMRDSSYQLATSTTAHTLPRSTPHDAGAPDLQSRGHRICPWYAKFPARGTAAGRRRGTAVHTRGRPCGGAPGRPYFSAAAFSPAMRPKMRHSDRLQPPWYWKAFMLPSSPAEYRCGMGSPLAPMT